MSPVAQRKAIAEACGWTLGADTNTSPEGSRHSTVNDPLEGVPRYVDSLDAMAVAEDHLLDLASYCRTLCNVVFENTWSADANRIWQGWWAIHATAAQRAEAFLREFGKWEDWE